MIPSRTPNPNTLDGRGEYTGGFTSAAQLVYISLAPLTSINMMLNLQH